MNLRLLQVLILIYISGCSTAMPDKPHGKLFSELFVGDLISGKNKIKPPHWVLAGSGVLQIDEGLKVDAFYGVGRSYGTEGSKVLAEEEARNKLAIEVNKFYRRLVDYCASIKDQNSVLNIDLNKLQGSINNTAATILLDVEIIDSWEDPISKDNYSLAQLKILNFQEKLISVSALSLEEKESLKNSSRIVFSRIQWISERKQLFPREGTGYAEKADRFYLF